MTNEEMNRLSKIVFDIVDESVLKLVAEAKGDSAKAMTMFIVFCAMVNATRKPFFDCFGNRSAEQEAALQLHEQILTEKWKDIFDRHIQELIKQGV